MTIFTKCFWLDAFERAVKTFAQTLLGIIGVSSFTPLNAKWGEVLIGSGFAAGISVLTSIVSANLVSRSLSPASVVPTESGPREDRDRGQAPLMWLVYLVVFIVVIIVLFKVLDRV